ncbi:MAG: glycosyltransferase family 2 protein [Pseudomonadota bacterium]
MQDQPPSVSVIMAARNAGPYLGEAIASVLGQSHSAVQLIISDDGSTDETPDIARSAMMRDSRMQVLRNDTPGGPAAARNRALQAADGDWIAIVDADDLIHPARFTRLLATAADTGADVVADDLIRFGAEDGHTLLSGLAHDGPWAPDATALLTAELATPPVPVGYLKPMIRRTALGALTYREDMSVGEDLDLLLRLALTGAQIHVLPEGYYLYRRHNGSISHRLGVDDVTGMQRAAADMAGRADLPPAMVPLLEQRRAHLDQDARFARLVNQLKAKRPAQAARTLASTPGLLAPLTHAALESLTRRLPHRDPARTYPCLTLPAAMAPAELVARTGQGTARLRVEGTDGLRQLGYVPGWAQADLIPPKEGWSTADAAHIATLPWPVTVIPDQITPGLVQVRTPTYCRPAALRRSLQSLQAQTHERWVCDVYDDDPKGSARAVVEGLADPRIRYHHGPRRFFASGNIDRCFSRSNPDGAEYFCTLEDDNLLLPGFLADNIADMAAHGVEIVFRNQLVEFDAETAQARMSKGGLLDRRLTERVYAPDHFRLALMADIGVSNGGLFWSHRAQSDLQVHVPCSATLQEYYRTFAIAEPIFVAMTPLAVWAENGASTARYAGETTGWLRRELTLKASVAELQRRAWQQAAPEHRAAFLDDVAFSYPRDQRARGLVKSLMRLNVERALPSSEVARLALRGLMIRLLGRPEPSLGAFLEMRAGQ